MMISGYWVVQFFIMSSIILEPLIGIGIIIGRAGWRVIAFKYPISPSPNRQLFSCVGSNHIDVKNVSPSPEMLMDPIMGIISINGIKIPRKNRL